jgi:hypothetical protein
MYYLNWRLATLAFITVPNIVIASKVVVVVKGCLLEGNGKMMAPRILRKKKLK